MRLTLRTLLAYLDDHLEPTQAKELGAKIQESEAAAEWVMRIRDVIRKRRLTAPVVSGPGCDLDANLVAEYLDSTLSPDDVVKLEGLYHESDVHLAEVAAAHQILTLVLGEPVDIGPLSRDRMYALGQSAQATPAVAAAGTPPQPVAIVAKPPAAMPAAATTSVAGLGPAVKPVAASRPPSATIPTTGAMEAAAERKPDEAFERTIPDYLKAPPLWQRALPVAIALLVIVWLGMLFTDRNMLSNMLGEKSNSAQQVAGGGPRPVPAQAAAAATGEQADRNEAADKGGAKSDVPKQSVPPEQMPVEEDIPGESVAAVDKANVDAPPPADVDETSGPALEPAPKAAPAEKAVPKPVAGKTSDSKVVAKVDTPDAEENVVASKPSSSPAPSTNRANPALYVSQDGIVLHFDGDRQGWYQLPHRAHVFADDALAVPEPFDAHLQLGREKHRVTVMGPAVVGTLDPSGDQPMGINLLRGRVILQPAEEAAGAAKVPVNLLLSIQGMNWQLELADPATRCGVEVIPREPHALEENFGPQSWSGKLYVWSGSVSLTAADGMTQTITGPDSVVLSKAPATPEAIGANSMELPTWERRLSNIARKNVDAFSGEFKDESSARDSLLGLVESPVYERSRLAVACLGLIGEYDFMLDVIDRNAHYESRVAAIVALRQWVNQAPENRDKLKESIAAKFYPEEVDTVYRLIWGYQEQDLRTKQISEQLVDWLEHPRPAVRELAWYYIKTLTNPKQEVFDSRGTPKHISTAVQRIRKTMEKDGTLLPQLPSKSAPVDNGN